MGKPHLASALPQIQSNILAFNMDDPNLLEILAYVRHWYAIETADGWIFGPSKFIGYADMDAKKYFAIHKKLDGRVTEKNLETWFVELNSQDAFASKLLLQLRDVLARRGKSLNAKARVHVLKERAQESKIARNVVQGSTIRITFDAEMLGGKPCIRGMRIRVTDILEMLAGGATRQEILDDFPYLQDEDITASLQFAAGAIDHRHIRAA